MKGFKLWLVLGSCLAFTVGGSLIRAQLLQNIPPIPGGQWGSRDYQLEFHTRGEVCQVKGLDTGPVRFKFDSPGLWTEQRSDLGHPRRLNWGKGRWILMVTESHSVIRAYPLKPQEVK